MNKHKVLLNFLHKKIEYKALLIGVIFFLLGTIIIAIIAKGAKINFNPLIAGWSLGFCFSCLTFGMLVFSVWLLIQVQNKYWFMLLFFIRILFYGIPIIIYSYHLQSFNLFCIMSSLILMTLATFASSIWYPKKNNLSYHEANNKNNLLKAN